MRPEFRSCATTVATSASLRHESPMRLTRAPNVWVGFVVMSTSSSVRPTRSKRRTNTHGRDSVCVSADPLSPLSRKWENGEVDFLLIGKTATSVTGLRVGLFSVSSCRVDNYTLSIAAGRKRWSPRARLHPARAHLLIFARTPASVQHLQRLAENADALTGQWPSFRRTEHQ